MFKKYIQLNMLTLAPMIALSLHATTGGLTGDEITIRNGLNAHLYVSFFTKPLVGSSVKLVGETKYLAPVGDLTLNMPQLQIGSSRYILVSDNPGFPYASFKDIENPQNRVLKGFMPIGRTSEGFKKKTGILVNFDPYDQSRLKLQESSFN